MPAVIVLAVAVPLLYGLGCFVYPFRPRRFERLFYASWQRTNSRRADLVILWPMGVISLFIGGWIWYGLASPLRQPVWPIFIAFCALVQWGAGVMIWAWGRRLPESAPEASRRSEAPPSRWRKYMTGVLLSASICAIAGSHYLWNDSWGLSRPREALMYLVSIPLAAFLAGIAIFVATHSRAFSRRIALSALAFFAAWGVAEASYWPTVVYPFAAAQWQDYRDPIKTPTVPTAKAQSVGSMSEQRLTFTYKDRELGVKGASVEHVDFAGTDLVAIEEFWESDDGPMTKSNRIFLGGEWRPRPKDYWRAIGRSDGSSLLTGKDMLILNTAGRKVDTVPMQKAGFPVVALEDQIIYSIDEDDDGESASEPGLLSEGVFATDYDGEIVWRAASDSDPRFRGTVFSFYGATRTSHDTALVVVYGGFPPNDESLALYEVDPSAKKFTRLPLPKAAFGTQAVVELGDDWLCALGSYDDGDGRHRLRAWRRDGEGDVLVAKVPALKGWVDWRVQGGDGEFVTWEDGTVRRIVPKLEPNEHGIPIPE